MSLRVQTNVEAFRAYRNLSATADKVSKSEEKLSSGYRINRAGDDAAGLAISQKLTSQVNGLEQAQRNAQDGISLIQTGEGAMNEVHAILQRVRELAVQFNNGTLSASDKAAITNEVTQLGAEVQRIGNDTKFNGIALLTGNAAAVSFQVGADDNQVISVTTDQLYGGASAKVDSAIFNFSGTVNLAAIDAAISNVSTFRSDFGAVQNRLEHALNNLAVNEENTTASLSRIRDVDVAQEVVNLTKLQIVQQAGTSILSQANQAPQSVLSLLR